MGQKESEMKDYSNLGRYLKQCRQDKGLTQTELGLKLKLHPQFVSNWERGMCAPPNQSLPKLINHLDINREKLVDVMLKDSKIAIEAKIYNKKRKNS